MNQHEEPPLVTGVSVVINGIAFNLVCCLYIDYGLIVLEAMIIRKIYRMKRLFGILVVMISS